MPLNVEIQNILNYSKFQVVVMYGWEDNTKNVLSK